MTVDASGLFAPLALRNLTVPNRFAMAPMTRQASPGGVPGPDVAEYYARRAAGGVGLIITEGVRVGDPSAAGSPDIPTLVEVGYPNSEAVTWWGVVAPAGTPKAVVERLNKEINAILKLPETISQLKNGGADAHGSSVEAFSALIKSDVPKWQSVIEKANLKPRG